MDTRPGPLLPKGYQQLTSLSASTALTVPSGSRYALIKAETQAVRFMDDGSSALTPAPGACTATVGGAGNVNVGTHSYKVTFVNAQGETTGGTTSNQINITSSAKTVDLSGIPLGGPAVTQRKVYRTVAGDAGSYLLLATIADNTTTTLNDNTADAGLGAAAPATNTAIRGSIVDVVDEFWYTGDLAAIRFIEVAASAKLNVSYYQ